MVTRFASSFQYSQMLRMRCRAAAANKACGTVCTAASSSNCFAVAHWHCPTPSLVWVALVLSIGGILISWFVGIKLPGLEYNNQKVEAAFRKELVYGEDDRKNYVQAPTILQLFTGIKYNYHKLFLHYGYFDLWAIWYRQLFVIVPFLIMAPGLFTAAFTLGIMMQVVNAFGEVKDAFSVFLYNWTRITELRSIYRRLMEFETAINFKNKLRKPRKSDVRA